MLPGTDIQKAGDRGRLVLAAEFARELGLTTPSGSRASRDRSRANAFRELKDQRDRLRQLPDRVKP
jgi:hypothetical protein